MKKPNLFIIGSVKCGTTTLYSYLKKSPEVFFPVIKEPHYFITNSNLQNFVGPNDDEWFKKYPKNLESYEALFSDADSEKIIGEASAMYMYFPNVAQDIYEYSPDAKIIGVIRNPIDRAYSNYLHHIREAMEPVDNFFDAITEELEGKRNNWAPQRKYIEFGRYTKQIERYFQVFPQDQIKILKFEDFITSPNKTLGEICSFLEIEDIFQNTEIDKHNVSGVPIYKNTHYAYLKVREIFRGIAPFLSYSKVAILKRKVENYYRNNYLKKPEMSMQSRELLKTVFHSEIKSLESLINMDLRDWM